MLKMTRNSDGNLKNIFKSCLGFENTLKSPTVGPQSRCLNVSSPCFGPQSLIIHRVRSNYWTTKLFDVVDGMHFATKFHESNISISSLLQRWRQVRFTSSLAYISHLTMAMYSENVSCSNEA